MMNSLTTSFEGLKVSYSSLQRFVKDECCLSFKLIRREAIERNSEAKIEQRYDYVNRLNDLKADYCSNCIFIDETGFNINMKRNFGWSTIGNTPVVKTPTTRSESRPILGAICIDGIVVLSLRKPKQLTQIKKRKLDDGEQEPITKGTVTAHYKQFLMDVMDELDKYPKFQNSFLVMDNASIHKNPSISRIIVGRGYRCLYLPPFYPEPNPIEQFLAASKG